MRTALTIAGSDSGAGAGIQADLKTFAAHGVYGTSAITAVTAQNTLGVTMFEAVSADLVTAQIEAVVADIGAHAVKTGMLANAAIVEAVAAAIKDLDVPFLVVDPVMIAKSGDRLIDEEAIGSLKTELIYRHTWTSRHDAELAIFAWIEGWYNPERIIAALGMRSPDEYEAAFCADTQNTNSETLIKVGNPESSLQ